MKLNCVEDRLNRATHLEPLSRLLCNVNNESFVMTVSSPYGCGKTFFINLWQKYLEDNGCKTLYYNAWENDIANNPFMSFVANFKELGIDEPTWQEIISAAGKVLTDEILSKTDTLANCISIASGNSIVGQIFKFFGNCLKKSKMLTSTTWEKAKAESLFAEQIEVETRKKEQIKALKTAIKKLIPKTKPDKTGLPTDKLIIFIDDLDRCCPAYAIKFLEYIKHIFDIENCVFVLAVDEEQLNSSVKVVYGNKNAEDFLSKIIDFNFKLSLPDVQELIKYFVNILRWDDYFIVGPKWGIQKEEKKQNFIDIFCYLVRTFRLSIRDVIHICQNLDVVFKSHDPDYISPTYILFVYVFENYEYKVLGELKPYLSGGQSKVTSFSSFLRSKNDDIYKGDKNILFENFHYMNINVASRLEDFLEVLRSAAKKDYPYNQTEAFFALSFADFTNQQYDNLYQRTKEIIQDIVELSPKREKEEEKMRLFYAKNGFY